MIPMMRNSDTFRPADPAKHFAGSLFFLNRFKTGGQLSMFAALISCLLILASGTIGSALAAENHYDIKSGMVEYAISGAETGNETLYFDNYGQKEARYIKVNIAKNNESLDEVQYFDSDWVYQYDPKNKTALKSHWQAALDPKSGQKRVSTPPAFGQKNIELLGGQKVGAKSILGYTCDIWEIAEAAAEVCLYKSIPLEVITTADGDEKRAVATGFRENSKIVAAKLELPKDAKIEDSPSSALSQREWALQQKELELKQKELDLKQQQQSKTKTSAVKKPTGNPLDEVDKATNTTNRVKSSLRNLKYSVFGK